MTAGGLTPSNPKIKRLRRLSGRRSSRSEDGAFIIEGPVLVREALAAGVAIEGVYVDVAHGALVAEFDELTPSVLTVASGVLASVLPTVSPQPVCAVASMTLGVPVADVVAGAVAAGRPLVVLVDVTDPGNAGTLLRAAEASGAAGVVAVGSGVDLYNPKVVRASAGSLFRLPFAVETHTAAMFLELAEHGVPALAAVARGGAGHLDSPLAGAVAIVLGNEAHGLDDDIVAECDHRVTVTMDGAAESLNVAMAGTVLCFEALRQRRLPNEFEGAATLGQNVAHD